ncbi:MAG: epoxyqueuosine reductase QueH [Erysipelotrichaceae bacterium]|nr:epoxyqueuosine reductase QueH [Erysipelotrichaceae bacterium]
MSNYYQLYLNDIHSLSKRERIMVHVCCGPCSLFPLLELSNHFDVTIFYSNSNIYPETEYQKRVDTLLSLQEKLNEPYEVIIDRYDHDTYMEDLRPYADQPEGGKRCYLCYEKRLEATAIMAKKQGYQYFTTVMSISDYKKPEYINEIGERLALKYGLTFIHSDFKKNHGVEKNNELKRKYQPYCQLYCGCEYSLR